MSIVNLLKYFNPKTYSYSKEKADEYLVYDMRYCRAAFGVIIMLNIVRLIAFNIDRSLRFIPGSNWDGLWMSLFMFFGAATGLTFLLVTKQLKNRKMWMAKTIRMYMQILIQIYVYVMIFVKKDIFAGTIIFTCFLVIHLSIHVNPIVVVVQSLIYAILCTPLVPDDFTRASHTNLVIFFLVSLGLCFYQNIHTRRMDKIIEQKNIFIKRKNEEIIERIQRENDIQESIIYAIADLVENRDSDTGDHIKNTSEYGVKLAQWLRENGIYADEITDDFIELIQNAAPMHDIGKIVIPDSILKAPRKLTNEEFEIMKTHTTEGGRIIRNLYHRIETDEYIEFASNIAEYHHEWWNGNGYPHGSKELEIPLEARIMTVIDVYDALIQKRCYKRSFSVEEALKILEEESGTHFDPNIIPVFVKHIREGK